MGKKTLLSSLLLVVLLAAASTIAATPATVSSTQPAIKLAVSSAGEISLSLGAKGLASGFWRLFPADFHGVDADQIAIGNLVESAATQQSPTRAQVVDTYTDAKATTDITLDGEDLCLSMHVQNLDAAKSLKMVAMKGLTFHFARNATGSIPSWHISYMQAHELSMLHPGLLTPVGAVSAHDDQFGFCVHSETEFFNQSLFSASWQKDGITPADCVVEFHTRVIVPPGKSRDIDAHFRISTDTSLQHLYADYKRIYTAHFPKLLYHADARPLAQFVAVDKSQVNPSNPHGYSGGIRRLDSAAGTGAYVRVMAPVLAKADALGIIFWCPGGYREPMYPPDFDEFPKSVQRNIPALVDGFKQRGLRVGLLARCGDGVKREEGKPPEVYRLDAGNDEQMKTLLNRFDHARDMGFDMFYLDSFGADVPNDWLILQKIRSHVGPDVLLYSEFNTDMTLPYAGHYCEWRGDGILWTTPEQYAAMRYICPDSTWLCLSRTRPPVPAVFAQLGLTPLVQDGDAGWLPTSRPAR
jgi:hypothetical protein